MNEQPQPQTQFNLTNLVEIIGDYVLKRSKGYITIKEANRRIVVFEIKKFDDLGNEAEPFKLALDESAIAQLEYQRNTEIERKKLNIINEEAQIKLLEEVGEELLEPLLKDISEATRKADEDRKAEIKKAEKEKDSPVKLK